MTSFTINLKIINNLNEVIYIPNYLLNKLQMKNNQYIPIYFGISNSSIARIKGINTPKNNIYISSKLNEILMIPFSKKILIKKENDGLKIGPLIGILTTDYTGRKFSNAYLKSEHPFSLFFKDMLTPEPNYPTYYFVFTPEQVDWESKTAIGFFLKNNNWGKITIPLPDVVYNRIPNRTIEKKDYVEEFKKKYELNNGKLFNPYFFNKWTIYNILASNLKTRPFIPETYLNPSINVIDKLLNKHKIIYLKPSNGSLGLGIYKIVFNNNKYIIQYRNNISKTNKAIAFTNINQLYKYLFAQKSKSHYILQQGIDLIEYQKNPVDFRVHIHKNINNKWEVTAIGAKVAGKGSVTTHLRTGGKLIDASKFLKLTYKDKYPTIKDLITKSAILIAKTTEENLEKPIGELGLDIGIDKNERIWLFEVNSKPGRSIFKHKSLYKAKTESNKRLIEYGIYLSDFLTKNNFKGG